jgi:hypothetical protein
MTPCINDTSSPQYSAPIDHPAFIETLAERTSDECGCPEHDIMMAHIFATVHMEPDGSGQAFVDFGDWDEEWHFNDCVDINDLKQKTAQRFMALPQLD